MFIIYSSFRLRISALALILLMICSAAFADMTDLQKTHYAYGANINSSNVGSLVVGWTYKTVPDTGTVSTAFGSISSTPAVKGKFIYFNDYSGNITKLNRFTGALIWKKNYISDFSIPGAVISESRNTPYIVGNLVIVGSNYQLTSPTCKAFGLPDTAASPLPGGCNPADGAIVLALNKNDGSLVWRKIVDPHPASKITGSISGNGSMILVPVANWEEAFASTEPDITQNPVNHNVPYPCCSDRGSLVAMDLNGNILWQSYSVPGNGTGPDVNGQLPANLQALLTPKGFYGSSFYGHHPTIDLTRNQVYVASAETTTAPSVAERCEQLRRSSGNPNADLPAGTFPAGVNCNNFNQMVHNFSNAIVAMDLSTGKVKWAFYTLKYDAWNHACAAPSFYGFGAIVPLVFPVSVINAANCFQNPVGSDSGFGQNPVLVQGVTMPNGSKQDLVIGGNKNGRLFALNPDTGALIWETNVDPGGIYGGLQFGIATDGKKVYFGTNNSSNENRDPSKPFVSIQQFLDFNGFSSLGLKTGLFIKRDGDPGSPYPAPSSETLPFPGPNLIYGQIGYPNTFPQDPNSPPAPNYLMTGPSSGPTQWWTLVNPPSDVRIDGVSVRHDPNSSNLQTIQGMVQAVNAATGAILWQRPAIDGIPMGTIGNGMAPGTLTVANNVVFIGYDDGFGTMVALDANTGKLLFKYNNQIKVVNGTSTSMINAGAVESGPMVMNKRVYWGVGSETAASFPDKNFIYRIGGNTLYEFILPSVSDDDQDNTDSNTTNND